MPENFCANTSHLSLKICRAHFGKGLVVANFLYKKNINIHKYTTFPNSYSLHSDYLGLPSGFQGSLKTFNCVQIPWSLHLSRRNVLKVSLLGLQFTHNFLFKANPSHPQTHAALFVCFLLFGCCIKIQI